MGSVLESDVCIVGAGVAGAIVARHCVDAGLDVIMIDAGRRRSGRAPYLRAAEMIIRDFRIPRMKLWRTSRYDRSEYVSVGNRFYELDGKAVLAPGGSTLGWGGDAYRLAPEDFWLRSATGRGLDWPIDYDELEPFYRAAEETLRVAGDHLDAGQPPRTSAFPLPARPWSARDQPFVRLAYDEGWPPLHHPMALAPDGGAFTADLLVNALDAQPKFALLTETAVTRVVMGDRSRVDGVECRTAGGEARVIWSGTVVVCAGGIETPNLLLRSTSDRWPDGLGNHSGHLGRHLISHTGLALGGRMRGIRLFDGPIGPTVSTRYFDDEREQGAGKFLLLWRPAPSGYLFLNTNLEQFPSNANRVLPGPSTTHFGTPSPVIDFNHDDDDAQREEFSHAHLLSLADRMGLDVTHERRFVLAHPMCTARMSDDAADGVVDRDLRMHDVDNLYVCGSAAFSSGGAVNPTVTIAALAHRLGTHLSAPTAKSLRPTTAQRAEGAAGSAPPGALPDRTGRRG